MNDAYAELHRLVLNIAPQSPLLEMYITAYR